MKTSLGFKVINIFLLTVPVEKLHQFELIYSRFKINTSIVNKTAVLHLLKELHNKGNKQVFYNWFLDL